jgi:hypothetical protein
MDFFIGQKKEISKVAKIRGKIIRKSLELYFSTKPIKVRYNKRGKAIRKSYNIENFAKEFGVDENTIYRWYKTGEITKWSKIRLVMMGILPESMW